MAFYVTTLKLQSLIFSLWRMMSLCGRKSTWFFTLRKKYLKSSNAFSIKGRVKWKNIANPKKMKQTQVLNTSSSGKNAARITENIFSLLVVSRCCSSHCGIVKSKISEKFETWCFETHSLSKILKFNSLQLKFYDDVIMTWFLSFCIKKLFCFIKINAIKRINKYWTRGIVSMTTPSSQIVLNCFALVYIWNNSLKIMIS